jgi:hypothetical protein
MSNVIPKLIEAKNLDQSWKDGKFDSIEEKKFKNGNEWLVTVKNDKETDQTKRTLYVFVTSNGALAGVNFTGK